LAGQRGELAYQAVSLGVFDVEGHAGRLPSPFLPHQGSDPPLSQTCLNNC
jgi:hypothetical protein